MYACAVVTALGLALAMTGCLPQSKPPVGVPLLPATSTAPPSGTETPAQPADSGADASSTKVSKKALDYAKQLGGWDHKGQDLYFIVGATFGTEVAAQAALDKALPTYGDMQPYFIVQRSDNFAGMAPGSWIVTEAHFKTPSDDNMAFARRGFPKAQVVRAQVKVTDPIPVYEDMVGGD